MCFYFIPSVDWVLTDGNITFRLRAMENQLETILSKLKARVRKFGLDKTAKDFGMKAPTIHRYINGDRSPSGKQLLILMANLK